MDAGARFPGLAAVVPTLNASASLPATLRALAGVAGDVVVADGGSTDATCARALAAGARVVRAPRGRGSQLAAGAAAATGDWLLFVHADSHPQDGWQAAAERLFRPARRRGPRRRLPAGDRPAGAAGTTPRKHGGVAHARARPALRRPGAADLAPACTRRSAVFGRSS